MFFTYLFVSCIYLINFNVSHHLDETKSLPYKPSPSSVEPQPPPIEHQQLQVEPQLPPEADSDPSTVGNEGVYCHFN